MLRTGLIGTAVTALCCFTPLMVASLTAVGLGAAAAWLDMVLLPLLAGFVLLTFAALVRRRAGT